MSKVQSVLPMIPENQRADVEAQAAGQLDLLDSLPETEKDNLLRWGILDTGEARDQQVIRGFRGEIGKSIPELNKAAQQEQSPAQ